MLTVKATWRLHVPAIALKANSESQFVLIVAEKTHMSFARDRDRAHTV